MNLSTTAQFTGSIHTFLETSPDEAAKLVKILTMAAKGGAAEAAVATAKAAKFAAKHNLDLSMLEADDVQRLANREADPIICKHIRVAKGAYRRPPCFKYVSRTLVKHFNVDIILSGDGMTASTVAVVGKKSDIARAEYLMFYLIMTFNRLWRTYSITEDVDTSCRDDFFRGVWLGLNKTLDLAAKEAKTEAWDGHGEQEIAAFESRYSLVVTEHRTKLDQAVAEHCGKVVFVRTRVPETRDYRVLEDGYAEGKNLTLTEGLGSGDRDQLGRTHRIS